jgi:hypothetical protein
MELQRAQDRRRKLNRCEVLRRIEVILSRLVNHANQAVRFGVAVRHGAVDLAHFEIDRIFVVAEAYDQTVLVACSP